MSGWARPGVKCVCILDHPSVGGSVPFKKGDVLTVDFVDCDGCIGLVEWPRGTGVHRSYSPYRFRPLVPPKTQEQDMEHFLPLLKTRELVE